MELLEATAAFAGGFEVKPPKSTGSWRVIGTSFLGKRPSRVEQNIHVLLSLPGFSKL